MKSYEETMLRRASNAYAYLYEDQMVGATEEYLIFLRTEFGPAGSHDWKDKKCASYALRRMICEVYESCIEEAAHELLKDAGVDEELKTFIGFSHEGETAKAPPIESTAMETWIARLDALSYKHVIYADDVYNLAKRIPKEDFTEELVSALLRGTHANYFIARIWPLIPACFVSNKKFLVELAKDRHSVLRSSPVKELVTKEVAEAVLEEVGMKALSSIPAVVRKELDLKACLGKDPRALSGVPKSIRTVEMCEDAILAAIALSATDKKLSSDLHNSKWYEWAITAVPGGPRALSTKVKAALAENAPHTLKVFSENGAFAKGSDGAYPPEAWELFYTGMTHNPRTTLTYAPVEMAQKCADYCERNKVYT